MSRRSLRRRPPTVPVTALLLAASLAFSGCQASSDAGRSAAPSSSASAPPATSGSADAEPSSTVAPADGPLLQFTRVSLHAPTGWAPMKDLVKFQKSAEDPDSITTMVSATELPAAPRSLTSEARRASDGFPRRPKFVGTVTAGGIAMYRVSGMIDANEWVEKFGGFHAENALTITFTFDPGVTPKQRRAAYESTLASIRWEE